MTWFDRELLLDPALPWIAVRTRARSEKRVAAVLSAWGMTAWAPSALLRRRWSDRWKMVEWPLFPGYVFARVPIDGWYPLLNVQGVQTVVKHGRQAAVLDPEMLSDVRGYASCLGALETTPEYVPWFEPGELVVVAEGPFAGVRATVLRLDGQLRVSVGVTMLGQGISVTLPAANLLRVPA